MDDKKNSNTNFQMFKTVLIIEILFIGIYLSFDACYLLFSYPSKNKDYCLLNGRLFKSTFPPERIIPILLFL